MYEELAGSALPRAGSRWLALLPVTPCGRVGRDARANVPCGWLGKVRRDGSGLAPKGIAYRI